jgi:hypothetical protein
VTSGKSPRDAFVQFCIAASHHFNVLLSKLPLECGSIQDHIEVRLGVSFAWFNNVEYKMTRSVRQHPFVANTAYESEKNDKRLAHMRERKWIHDHLKPTAAVVEDFDIPTFHEHPKSGRDLFAKHGKALHAEAASAFRK